MSSKSKLEKEVWEKRKYYHIAKKSLEESNHEGMRVLQNLASNSDSILDLGCGEGSRLNILSKNKHATGVDLSNTAISMAKKNYPKINFIKADLEKIPLKDNSFDLVYSCFVLEHLANPEKILLEALRLTQDDGYIVLIAPNYGAPNRASPPFKRNRWRKLFFGFLQDLIIFLKSRNNLHWSKVEPIATNTKYDVDWDTTIEPYANTLKQFLLNYKIKIEYLTTCWSEELPSAKIHQRVFRFFGTLDIYPFNMWGPHLIIVGKNYEQ